jgi:light-regulated signal transduction histidine kinase (bacteriophytochrome)
MSIEIQIKLFTSQMNALFNSREENKGAGIGLLLVKGFVEKNEGQICFESIKGEGFSFNFTLLIENPLENMDNTVKKEFEESA